MTVRLYHPHQCGWLRRPECDYPRLETWEKPDGSLHVHDPNQGKLLLAFNMDVSGWVGSRGQ